MRHGGEDAQVLPSARGTVEWAAKALCATCACVSLVAASLICLFLLVYGCAASGKIGLAALIAGKRWQPSAGLFGILPMVAGTLCITALAVLLAAPAGVLTAVFVARYCPAVVRTFARGCLRLLALIPSVVYGFFGLSVIVPAIGHVSGTSGTCILAASLVLAVMSLPTIASTLEAAIQAVPQSYFVAAAALGACKDRGVFCVELHAARYGIIASVVLGAARAAGETVAVMMVAGNQAWMPHGVIKGARTLTSNIALQMGWAVGLHRGALIASALLLLVFTLVTNLVLTLLTRHEEARHEWW